MATSVHDQMERREQVFISSTYLDLKAERQEVIQTLLEADCIPAGMELFPATDADKWTVIAREIERSDYYVVILGGRYGSVDPALGLSFTEMEFDHALKVGVPVMGFLHGAPGKLTAEQIDLDEELRTKLDGFRKKVESGRMVKYWTSAAELGGAVAKSLIKIRQTDPAEGWIRASNALTPEVLEELSTLRVRVRELEADIRDQQQQSRLLDSPVLESGSDTANVEYFLNYWSKADVKDGRNTVYRERPRQFKSDLAVSWDEILIELGPRLIPEGPSSEIDEALKELVRTRITKQDDFPSDYAKNEEFGALDSSVREVTFHLKALGLIAESTRRHPIADTETYWSLSPAGEAHLVALKSPASRLRTGDGEAKRGPAKKAPAKKAPAKKAPAKKAPAKKAPAKKT